MRSSQSISTYGTVSYLKRLHVEGNRILDDLGREFRIAGINVRQLPWGRPYEENIPTLEDFQRIKSWGFNAIRCHVYWRYFTPNSPTVEETCFVTTGRHGVAMDILVSLCEQSGLYFIPNLWMSPWEPAPDWAFPGITDIMAQYEALLTGTAVDERQSIINIWSYIMNRYKDKAFIIPDLWNEVQFGSLSQDDAAGFYASFMEEIIDGIRAVESFPHIIVIERMLYHDMEQLYDVDRDNIVWSSHIYTPHSEPYDRATDYEKLRRSVEWDTSNLMAFGKPYLLGEFGRVLYPEKGGDVEWFEDIFAIMDEFGVKHWCVYNYARTLDEDFSLVNPDGTSREPYVSIIRGNIPT